MRLIRFISDKVFQGLGKPIPIKTAVPEWYRRAEYTYSREGHTLPGLKKCAPFLDVMLTGYAVTLPIDVHVSKDDLGNLKINWDGPEVYRDFILKRDPRQGETIPRPAGHFPDHLAFSGKWGWRLPKGYSALVVAPINRWDLPFTITGGVIDSDEFWAPGNLPFFMREDFEGTIPAGTPIAQIIPIKREHWVMVENDKGIVKDALNQGPLVRSGESVYKRHLWHKKRYD
jgi:hypothetical protein